MSNRCLGYCDVNQRRGQHEPQNIPGSRDPASPTRLFPLIVVIIADHRGPASGPQFVKVVNSGVLAAVVDSLKVLDPERPIREADIRILPP